MRTLLTDHPSELFKNDVNCDLTVADAVWVGTALLQINNTAALADPIPSELIVAFVQVANLTNGLEKSIYLHVNQHCVANRPPNSNRSRMLFETGRGERRLFRSGDKYDPAREGAPTHPGWDKLPAKYRHLRQWYEDVWEGADSTTANDPLLALIGAGSEVWQNQHADEYLQDLRSNWGDAR